MSITREEAILELETMLAKYAFDVDEAQAIGVAFAALRPVSRERVEEVWRAHWNESTHLGGFVYCSRCGYNALEANNYTFCHTCGSPFTDEAVEMVMERMEALKDGL